MVRSRALNVFVDTITIMYGMGGRRGIVKTRALSFTLYLVALLIGVVVLPLVLAGPSAVNRVLPPELDDWSTLYWPIVIVLSTGFLNTLYHLSVPVRTPWISDLLGAFLALSCGSWAASCCAGRCRPRSAVRRSTGHWRHLSPYCCGST